MPTEDGIPFLVDPAGSAPEQLSKHEYQTIRTMLEITRDENLEDASEIMEWTITSIKDLKRPSPNALLLSILWHYANYSARHVHNGDDCGGVLAGHHQSHQVHWITEHELKTLGEVLTCLRAGSWFAGWLDVQVEAIANGKNPAEQFPTPLQIAATLNLGWIKTHEEEMEVAREMVRMRPDLLFPAPAEPPVAPAPLAAAETSTSAAKQPAKTQLARKSRKQGRHA
jgi:hypothetical protein